MWFSGSLSVRCFLRSLLFQNPWFQSTEGEKKAPGPWLGPKGTSCGMDSSPALQPLPPSSLQEQPPPACVLFPKEARLLPDSLFWTRNSSTLEYYPSFLSPMANFSCPSRPTPSNTISLKLFWNPSTVTICISTSPCFAYFTPLITQRAMIFFMSVSPTRPCSLCISWVKNCDV